jgi:hypothetical protein
MLIMADCGGDAAAASGAARERRTVKFSQPTGAQRMPRPHLQTR